MQIQNNQIALLIAVLVIGAVIGWLATSRHYGVGPLANLGSRSSSAMMAGGECVAERRAWVRAWDTVNESYYFRQYSQCRSGGMPWNNPLYQPAGY